MGNANIIAFSHPLLDDWELMEEDVQRYRQRVRSAIREEMIHALQIVTVKKRYDECAWRIAAQLYYEDWSITSMERLKETDRKLHGRDGYLAIELIRQLVQIRRGELTSEEAKGNAWDKHRRFYVGNFGTAENLLKSMAETLRQAVPKLVTLSPTLAEALAEIEEIIQTIDECSSLSWCSSRAAPAV